jgi:hypothetical protein
MIMNRFLIHILGSRWLVACFHLGLWLLIALAASNLGGKAPDLREGDSVSTQSQNLPPVDKLALMFGPNVWPKSILDTNSFTPFFTRHFIPPPAPPPPAPTTKKIELTYQGFYQTGEGPKQTIVKLADSFLITAPGAKVTANLFIADATMQVLTLTNLAKQTNILTLNTKKEIEVPLP